MQNIQHVKNIVLGAGISGLTKAYSLQKKGTDFLVLEASSQTGGAIQSIKKEGYELEKGPNSFALNNETKQLIQELKLEDKLLSANNNADNKYIFLHQKLTKVSPAKLILSSEFLSLKSKWKLATEFLQPPQNIPNESIANFVRRRLTSEFLDHLINPVVSGIFAGNPEKLCLKSVFPAMYDMEQNYGSLIKAALKKEKIPKRNLINFKGGLSTLTNALSKQLKQHIQLDSKVVSVKKTTEGYLISYLNNGDAKQIECQQIHTTIPAYTVAEIFDFSADLKKDLAQKEYPAVITLKLAFPIQNIKKDLSAFGFLVPEKEQLPFLGVIFNSKIFDAKSPDATALFTIMIGGTRMPNATKNAVESVRLAKEKIMNILQISGNPCLEEYHIHPKAIPQYNIGHQDFIAKIKQFETQNKGLFFSGNWLNGISVGDCIKNNLG